MIKNTSQTICFCEIFSEKKLGDRSIPKYNFRKKGEMDNEWLESFSRK
jgi:hypothetical protein